MIMILVVLKIKAFLYTSYVCKERVSTSELNTSKFRLVFPWLQASYPLITVRLERPEGRELLENASRPSEASKKALWA